MTVSGDPGPCGAALVWCLLGPVAELVPHHRDTAALSFPDGVDRNSDMELLVLPSAQSWEISKVMDEEIDPNVAPCSCWQLSLMDSFLIFI